MNKGSIMKDKNDWPQSTIKPKTNHENSNFINTEDAASKKKEEYLNTKKKFNLE